MEIYIEYLLIDNLIINSLIILLTTKILNYKIKFKNVIFVSIIATTFSFIMPYILIYLNSICIFIIKISVGFIIVLFIKKYKSFLEYIIYFLVFITSTFLFGGMCFGLTFMLNLKTTMNGIVLFSFELPIGLIILALCIYLYLIIKLINYIKNNTMHNQFKYDIVVNISGVLYNKVGYYDTGNIVYDNNLHKPVLIISFDFYEKIVNSFNAKDNMKFVFLNHLRNPHYIQIETISSKDKIFAFEIDMLTIFTSKKIFKTSNVVVGVSKTKFKDFDCILHRDFFKT